MKLKFNEFEGSGFHISNKRILYLQLLCCSKISEDETAYNTYKRLSTYPPQLTL